MNKSLIFIFIIVFLVKTGNVFSNSNIFDVDNIYINKDSSKSREQLLNLAFKMGFKLIPSEASFASVGSERISKPL